MMMLFRISVQLSVEPLIAHAVLQGVSNLIVSISHFALEKHFVCFNCCS